MIGWLSDFFRLGWGALYWNSRKSWHALRGRRGRCPCQVASDSGRAYETGCEAIPGYRQPGRFRAICPLLAKNQGGDWVCSVNAEDVRPFWPRALALYGGGALSLALVATLAAFFLLRTIGYDITFRQVAWPPAWREFRSVQSKLYLDQARAAHAAGRTAEALVALSNAYELNPRDYPAGVLLAQLWQTGQPALSDNVYARLLAEHPDQRETTAQAWYRALLSRGDFPSIIRLSGERILAGGASPGPAWLQAFLFAARQTPEIEPLAQLLAAPSLPASVRPLIQLELDLRSLSAAERIERLHAAAARSLDPFETTHLLRRLLEENRADLVLPLATAPGSALGDREKARLQLDAYAQLGRAETRAALVRELLALPTHPAICELLSAQLIAYPDRDLLRAYGNKLTREPISAPDAVYPQLIAHFAACGIDGDPTLIRDALGLLTTATGRRSSALASVEALFLSRGGSLRIDQFLPVLQPMPLEVAYALHSRLSFPPAWLP